VNPLASFGIMAAQMSTQFGLFLGLRAMLVLPVEQLKAGGFWHLMDLTASDPYFITPVLTTVLINVQLAITGRDMMSMGASHTPHIFNGLRVLSVVGAGFLAWMPVGLNIHIITSVLCLIVQNLVLRIPTLRTRLGLPPIPALKPGERFPTLVDSWNYVKQWTRNRVDAQIAVQTERERKIKRARR